MTSWFRVTISAPDLQLQDVLRVMAFNMWEANVQPSFGIECGEIHPGAIVTVHGSQHTEGPLPSIEEVVAKLRLETAGFGCAFVETSDGRSGCSETFAAAAQSRKNETDTNC